MAQIQPGEPLNPPDGSVAVVHGANVDVDYGVEHNFS